jgi:RNA polymerase sigma factor (sigma-70 family)
LWARNYAQRDIAEAIARDGVALACSVDACSAEAHDPEVDIYRAEMSALLHAAIAALGYHQREAIRLYLDGHTYEQIGVIMAVSRQSARIRVSQAVERITKKLRREI